MSKDLIFKAISDHTRRQIISLLVAAGSAMNLHAIAENFDMSRQAVTKHIKVLEKSGIIKVNKRGREQICMIDLKPLKDVDQWIANYRQFWTEKLDNLEDFLDKNSDHL